MILHVDLNSFFARVEQQTNPKLRNRPIGVLGKGHKGARTCVCAASPEAKKFGVKSGCSTWEARQLCPSIILVPPDYPKYLDVSRRFMAILENYSPHVEIFSIDEAFLDLKIQNSKVRERLKFGSLELAKYLGIDAWPACQQGGDLKFSEEVWSAIAAAILIKQQMRQELGEFITATIGIAWGKVFAKLAGELKKSDGLVILEKETWLNRVGSLSITELCGIGRRLAQHLAVMGVLTINDLSHLDAGVLVARFGRSTGMHLWQIGQGIDPSPVISSRHLEAPKSIGHQITLDKNTRFDQLEAVIAKLTLKVGRRLRRSKQATTALYLNLSLASGVHLSQMQRYQPGIFTDTDLLMGISRLSQRLRLPRAALIQRVGVGTFNLEQLLHQALPLYPHAVREAQLADSLDDLRDRYGDDSIHWASGHGVDFGVIRDWRGPHAVLDR